MKNLDRYKEELTGAKLKFNSLEAAFLYIRNNFPSVYAEGSTGFERTYWVREADKPQLVAHAWETGRVHKVWNVRMKVITV